MRSTFPAFCAFITAFSETDLQGTGLVDDYLAIVQQTLGETLWAEFDRAATDVINASTPAERDALFQQSFVASPILWPVVSNLLSLWYLGIGTPFSAAWYQQQDRTVPPDLVPGTPYVPSEAAYIEQLSYRAAHAHPPGAKPTGYGSWSVSPIL